MVRRKVVRELVARSASSLVGGVSLFSLFEMALACRRASYRYTREKHAQTRIPELSRWALWSAKAAPLLFDL